MDLIYRIDIFDAITKSLLEEEQNGNLNYTALYNKCIKKLNIKLSHGAFHRTLDRMTRENLLNKTETTSSKLKLKPVSYSLSEKAKEQFNLKILGNDEKTQKFRTPSIIDLFRGI